MLLIQNVTEMFLKELEKRKVKLTNKYKTLFIHSFNHEVRHPINNIQTIAALTIKDIEHNRVNLETLNEN